ncbi:amidase [Rhizobium lusitanum]|uniref:amidase n=1 Tax=Rhizobium lusitanum TaxID=293958 RepID=UPI0015747EC2|nr:amidase [Rhizobium lusitanum]NTJ11680.1 amidase [Rhizobium lusitanum]
MTIARPTTTELAKLADSFGFHMSMEELEQYRAEMAPSLAAYDIVDALDEPLEPTVYTRSAGCRPAGTENKFGAWAWKSDVETAPNGPLAGKTLVLKDNVALAGVPMSNGTTLLVDFIPERDATVVTRILEASGKILGKATCESFCMSGGSHTSQPEPVHNPWRHGYSAGGSSSGCGALVAAGEADMAIGGDQGGSIRIPSSYCGIYGMKPSWGLVPYTGIMPIEATIDHAGPMTRTVADNALLLDIIAGDDGLDPRQRCGTKGDYLGALTKGVAGLRIAMVTEGFTCETMQPGVAQKVRGAAAKLAVLGAIVTEISIPQHVTAASVWTPIGAEGLTMQMMIGNGMGFNWKGRYDVGLLDRHAGWRQHADELSEPLKLSMLVGRWALEQHNGRYYAKAQNLARAIKAVYDSALETADLLLMPTLPRVASPLPAGDAPLSKIIQRAAECNVNTCPFDVTGHPAMSIPCGLSDGLPVGMMLVAKSFDEATIYRAAAAFEGIGDWRQF